MTVTASRHDDSLNRFATDILDRLQAAGSKGLNVTGLRLGSAGSASGKGYRDALKRLLNEEQVRNLGTAGRPHYVLAEHFRPLEIAYDQIDRTAREAGIRLLSKKGLSKGLTGVSLQKVDEAIKLLVAEGILLRLKCGANQVYLHTSALPNRLGDSKRSSVDPAALRRAYDETVKDFGYPDVLIHEVYLRLGGELEPLKETLMNACRSGDAIPGVGDWSLSSEKERAAALYINGHPHLRIRLKG